MLENLHFDKDGLIPVVVQEVESHDVLLQAYMNTDALQMTLKTRLAHFWSRSRSKLWQKGETSGNVQEVVSVYLNCEGNSLLLQVRQRGQAACHDGFHSCYYRKLTSEGTWEIVQSRLFNPAEVYPDASLRSVEILAGQGYSQQGTTADDKLAASFRSIYSAYCYLRDHDLESVSGTSRRLRHPDLPWLQQRALQELSELAGVISSAHVHSNPQDDTILEGRQASYWLLMCAAANHLLYDSIIPHEHLRVGFEAGQRLDMCALDRFARTINLLEQPLQGSIQLGLRLVGSACQQQGVTLLALAEAELQDLRQKNYLRGSF